MKILKLKKNEDKRLRRGHPWAFSNELDTKAGAGLSAVKPGEVVELVDHAGKLVGVGYANPHSLIAVRLLAGERVEIGPALIAERLTKAKALRDRLCPGRESYRAVFSESDYLPGLIVDRYGSWLCAQVLTAGMERLWPIVLDALKGLYESDGIVLRNDSSLRTLEGLPKSVEVSHGEYPGAVEARIAGMKLMVDLTGGQKTGFFLDQVDNYAMLDNVADGAEVLDLFCHTGAWALYAAKAGAKGCTGVDSSEAAVAMADENARLNGLTSRAKFVRGDVFDTLKSFAADGKVFDVVVADPPAFIKSRSKMAQGLKGYKDLNTKAMKAVKPSGFLISCSCSHHLGTRDFLDMLRASALRAGRAARVLEVRSQSKDHPVLMAAPETGYLKCALLLLD